jgi:hypothetical protein
MKSAQAFSMDIMIALVIFIGVIFTFYLVIDSNQEPAEKLSDDASRVLQNLISEDPDLGIVDGIEVDETKLEQLLGEDYDLIKERIRTENDFCIFLEDQGGNIIYISGQPGIGSDKILVSDQPCG